MRVATAGSVSQCLAKASFKTTRRMRSVLTVWFSKLGSRARAAWSFASRLSMVERISSSLTSVSPTRAITLESELPTSPAAYTSQPAANQPAVNKHRPKNLTPSRLRPISPFSFVGQGRKDAKFLIRNGTKQIFFGEIEWNHHSLERVFLGKSERPLQILVFIFASLRDIVLFL